jgi:hypothetical protein
VTDEIRQHLIELVENSGYSCRKAAARLGIAYNNAKVICRVYRTTGRTHGTPKHLKRLVARYMKDPHNLNLDPTSERYHELMDFLGQLPEDHPLNPNHEVPTTNLSPKVSTEAIIINLSSSVPTRTSDSQEELTSQSASFISDTVSEVNGNPVLPE